MSEYRHELKYAINYADYLALRQRIRPLMKPDPHTDANGRYTIRSIYFDNYNDKALREKVDGVAIREKFRIRYYNDDLSYLTLEKKCKHNNLCLKLDAPITAEECSALLAGDWAWMPTHREELVRELYTKMHTQQLRPRVLVSYVREPYLYPAGNVRVTFDSEIRTSLYCRDFLEPGMDRESFCDIPATDAGEIILEVKFDEYLPTAIACLLQTGTLRQGAFSKYGACRRYG